MEPWHENQRGGVHTNGGIIALAGSGGICHEITITGVFVSSLRYWLVHLINVLYV